MIKVRVLSDCSGLSGWAFVFMQSMQRSETERQRNAMGAPASECRPERPCIKVSVELQKKLLV